MKVLGIGVEVQYTKAMEDGSYKKVCFSANAQLEEGEDRCQAQRALYQQLAEDLRTAFSPNGKKPPTNGKKDYPENPIPKGTHTGKPREKIEEKVCEVHGCAMKEFTKESRNGKTSRWRSHRLPDGSWCNGKAKKGQKR